jgi:hypothetical protein
VAAPRAALSYGALLGAAADMDSWPRRHPRIGLSYRSLGGFGDLRSLSRKPSQGMDSRLCRPIGSDLCFGKGMKWDTSVGEKIAGTGNHRTSRSSGSLGKTFGMAGKEEERSEVMDRRN